MIGLGVISNGISELVFTILSALARAERDPLGDACTQAAELATAALSGEGHRKARSLAGRIRSRSHAPPELVCERRDHFHP